MTAPYDPFASPLHRSSSLATAVLPRRVRTALEELYALIAEELARQLERMLADYEQQLSVLADQARSQAAQGLHFRTLREVRQNRADLVPKFLIGLETALSRIREPALPAFAAAAPMAAASLAFDDLRLVDHEEASESTVLRAMAMRQESRASLPLQLLGQRFGVLAGAPAFDPERLPVGPQQLGRVMLEASEVLHVGTEARQLLLRTFDRHVLGSYEQLVELMNDLLARHNVLAGLSFVPLRTRPRAQTGTAKPGGPAPAKPKPASPAQPLGLDPRQTPHTGWLGDSGQSDPAAESADFELLQKLLADRRNLIGKLRPAGDTAAAKGPLSLPTRDVLSVLGKLQEVAKVPRSVAEVRQALLLQGRQPDGEPITLSREDSDTFELLGRLYTEIGRELRQGAANTTLLERLQVPLLRVALQDREFFVRQQHPARQLLNAVAESGARWLADDDADPQLGVQLREAVDHVVDNYDGDAKVFEKANQALQDQLQSLARKAEVTERRHVEAARGKEKLVLAKQRAAAVLDEAIRGHRLPRFLHTLLSQAWADVLTLTMLRHGEDSAEWARQLQATAQIVAANGAGVPAPAGLNLQIEAALTQVGYHADEAGAIALRLTAGIDDDDDGASRTELAMRLKARSRLGEDALAKSEPLPPRTSAEDACYGQLRTLPFGTWFEFSDGAQSGVVRRRLSWYSPVTNNALFVNQRGQRIGEHSLDALARMMANGQARIVTTDKGRLVDRAWNAALNALRHLGGRGDAADASAQADA